MGELAKRVVEVVEGLGFTPTSMGLAACISVVVGAIVGVLSDKAIRQAYSRGCSDTERRLWQMRLDAANDAEAALVWRRESLGAHRIANSAEGYRDMSGVSRSRIGTQIIMPKEKS